MILQALVEHYEDLAAQGKLARPGWSDANISYVLYINDAGELEQAVSLKREEERGKSWSRWLISEQFRKTGKENLGHRR